MLWLASSMRLGPHCLHCTARRIFQQNLSIKTPNRLGQLTLNAARFIFTTTKSAVVSGKTKEFSRLLALARPERFRIFNAILLLGISSAVTISVPFFMGRLIDIIFDDSKPDSDNKFNWFSDLPMLERLKRVCFVLSFVFVIGAIANAGRVFLLEMASVRIVNRLRTNVFSSVLAQDIAFFDQSSTGELVNRLSNDASRVGYSITSNVSDGLRSFISAAGGVYMMVYVSPSLAALGLSIVPPVTIGAIVYGRYIRELTKQVNDSLADATKVAQERISNVRIVRAFSAEEKEADHYSDKIEKVVAIAKRNALASAGFFGITGLSGNLIMLSVLYKGGQLMTDNLISVGDMSSFMLYAVYVGVSIADGTILNEMKGRIDFCNVNFVYPTRPTSTVFDGFTLSVPQGTSLAIVGPSGGGKSTIASLLLRFYDPDIGTIAIDDIDIRQLNGNWLRRKIGYVPQDPVLFSGTIRENILYGLDSDRADNVSENEIICAIKDAGAFSFVDNFPQKLNTLVGERGIALSGGQRQRIAIARALMKDPKILIFDEATSALDSESEFLVKNAINSLMIDGDRTVLIIAHRLSTIRHANQIAVLSDGRIAEFGNYLSLMKKDDGIFKKLVEKQTFDNNP